MTSTQVAAAASTERKFALEGGLSGSTLGGIAMAIAVETVAFHFYLATIAQPLAWAFTTLNAALLFWMWRGYRATAVLTVREHDVEVALKHRIRLRFERSSIASAEPAMWRSVPEKATEFMNAAAPLEPNVLITLRGPVEVRLALGISKAVTRVAVRTADAEALLSELRH